MGRAAADATGISVEGRAAGGRADEIPGGAVTKNEFVSKEEKPEKALNPELEDVRALYDVMLDKGLEALELKDEESRIRLTRRPAAVHAGDVFIHHPAPPVGPGGTSASKEAIPPEASTPTIVTPLAGVFYRASSPTSVSFVNVGDVVEPGQTLCIVEAMKVMNEIKAESRCRIAKIVAENGRPVTASQTLFQIEPA